MLGYFCDWGEFQNALNWFERALALGDKSAHWEIARMYFRERKNVRQTLIHAQQITEAKPGIEVTSTANVLPSVNKSDSTLGPSPTSGAL